MTNAEDCNVVDCDQPVVSFLENDALCRAHFISACYTRLEQYAETQNRHGLSVSDSESMRRFIHECVRQTDEIEHATKNLDNLERARLLHIIEEATDLGRYLRRS